MTETLWRGSILLEEGVAWAGLWLGLIAAAMVFALDVVQRPREAWFAWVPAVVASVPLLILLFGFDGDLDLWSHQLFERSDQVAWLLGERSTFVYRHLAIVTWLTAAALTATRWLRPHQDEEQDVSYHHPRWWPVLAAVIASIATAVLHPPLGARLAPVITVFLLTIALARDGARGAAARPVIGGLLVLCVTSVFALVMAVPITSNPEPWPHWLLPCIATGVGLAASMVAALRAPRWVWLLTAVLAPLGSRVARLPPAPRLPTAHAAYPTPANCLTVCTSEDLPCPQVGEAAHIARARYGWRRPVPMMITVDCDLALAPEVPLDALPRPRDDYEEAVVRVPRGRLLFDRSAKSHWRRAGLVLIRTEAGMEIRQRDEAAPPVRIALPGPIDEFDEIVGRHNHALEFRRGERSWTVQEAVQVCDDIRRTRFVTCIWP